jgi:hypothetical protein
MPSRGDKPAAPKKKKAVARKAPAKPTLAPEVVDALVAGTHGDPFGVLGIHKVGRGHVVRAFIPGAESVEAIDAAEQVISRLERRHDDGLFEGRIKGRLRYWLRAHRGDDHWIIDDPYAFGPVLGPMDDWLLADEHLRGAPRVVARAREATAGSPGASSPTRSALRADMGFTHVELMPVNEHPSTARGATRSRATRADGALRRPRRLRAFVDRCTRGDRRDPRLGARALPQVDAFGLARFDGTALYEHEDPRQGEHPDWGTPGLQLRAQRGAQLPPDRERALLARRVPRRRPARRRRGLDALPRLLAQGGRVGPQPHGGRENLEAIAFLRELNERLYGSTRA